MDDVQGRLQAALDSGARTVLHHVRRTPAETLARLARACEDLGIDRWDGYGERGPVARLEAEVAELLGKPAAAMFPSGIMAQQAVLRVWCDRAGTRRIAMPDLSHLLKHEADGPRRLHGFEIEHLTTGRAQPTAEALAALPGPLASVLVELPLRHAGCALPSWEDLAALSAAAEEGGVARHLDGARLWESQPFYDRPLAELADLFDSVYVSLYKGLGGLAGALLAADEDVVEEARVWRKRMGGTIFRMTPEAVAGLVGLREELPRMAEYVAWARSLAGALESRGVRVNPSPPHTSTFEVFADGAAAAVNERLLALVEREGVVPSFLWWDSPVPGVVTTEIAVGSAAPAFDPDQVADWLAEIAHG